MPLPVDKTLYSRGELLHLLIPLVLEQMLYVAVGVADTMMIASFGEDSVSGVALVDSVNLVIAVFFAAMATGGAVVTAQYLGGKKYPQARASAKQLILVALLVSFLMVPVMYVFRGWLFRVIFGRIPLEVYQKGMIYFRITVFTYPLMSLYMAVAALFRVMNRTTISMWGALAMNIINIAGNWLLLFVVKMGVAGVAYATFFSRLVSVLFLCILLTNRSQELWVTFWEKVRLDWKLIGRILYIGIPSGIENVLFQAGRLFTTGIVALFGTTQIAAYAVALTFSTISTMFGGAFGLGMITVIGRSVGTGSEQTMRYYTRKMMKYAYVSNAVWNLLLFFILPFVLNRYTSLGVETRQLVWTLIWLFAAVGSLVWPMSFVFPQALRSANDVRFVMFISVASMVFIRVGAAVFLAKVFHVGVMGVWCAMFADWVVRTILFSLRWKSNRWLKKAALR